MVNSPEFDNFYNSFPNQNELDSLILNGEKEKLKALFEKDKPIEFYQMGELRLKARQLGITYYYNLSRSSLLSEIMNALAREDAERRSVQRCP